MNKKDVTRIADFLFEIGTMRKIPRIHRQTLLTDDVSDNITSHSYRVALIAWFLAKMEKADPYKTIMMALIHDLAEIRSNDHNWVHKKYVKIFESEIAEEQLGTLPFSDLKDISDEYEKRKSKESIIAKDADRLDQLMLLREYEWQGNREALKWLYNDKGKKVSHKRLNELKTESAKKVGQALYKQNPSDWWQAIFTSKNR